MQRKVSNVPFVRLKGGGGGGGGLKQFKVVTRCCFFWAFSGFIIPLLVDFSTVLDQAQFAVFKPRVPDLGPAAFKLRNC